VDRKNGGSGQWAMSNGQWVMGSAQYAITVGIGQWTFKFGSAMFGFFTKYSLHFFRFKYLLEAKICFWSKFVSHGKFTDSLRCETSG
jgi:hypothetical protein